MVSLLYRHLYDHEPKKLTSSKRIDSVEKRIDELREDIKDLREEIKEIRLLLYKVLEVPHKQGE